MGSCCGNNISACRCKRTSILPASHNCGVFVHSAACLRNCNFKNPNKILALFWFFIFILFQEADDSSEATIASFPCMASPIVYSPPPPPSLSGIVGDLSGQVLQRSGSSILKKSYTSDDELDELDSPLKSVLGISLTSKKSKSVGNGGRSVIRYQLLRQVWKDAE